MPQAAAAADLDHRGKEDHDGSAGHDGVNRIAQQLVTSKPLHTQ